MSFLIVLTAWSLIGVDDSPAKLWSGNFAETSITLCARAGIEENGDSVSERGMLAPVLTEYWLEAKSESEDRARCIWTEVGVNAPMQAAAYLRQDGHLGVVYFNSRRDSPWVDRIVLRRFDLTERLSAPSIERPDRVTPPPRRNSGGIGYVRHYPLHVIRSQLMTAYLEFRGCGVTMQGLVFADDKWKVTICISGAAFDFTLGDDGWVVSEGDHETCCDVPPRVSKEEFPALRLPHPDAERNPSQNRIIMFLEEDMYNRSFGAKGFGGEGGFGADKRSPSRPKLREESR